MSVLSLFYTIQKKPFGKIKSSVLGHICVFLLPNKIMQTLQLKKKHLFSKIYSIGCDFPMPKIGCDFPMPDIAKHFDTTMQKKTGKTNSAVFRNLSGLHFQYILNGLPPSFMTREKDVRNPFSPFPRCFLKSGKTFQCTIGCNTAIFHIFRYLPFYHIRKLTFGKINEIRAVVL